MTVGVGVQAGRDPAPVRRLANINGAIIDGADDGWVPDPLEHCV